MGVFANVNVGTVANDNTGNNLRAAFQIINLNFANIAAGNANIVVNSPVSTVAGRTGNVTLTVNDIIGFNSVGFSGTLPTYSNSSGVKGQLVASGSYLYVCTAANTWVRI